MATTDLTKNYKLQNYDVAYEVIVIPAVTTASIGDSIDVVTVKNGRQIIDAKVYADGTASSTVSLGDATVPARFLSAVSSASSGTFAGNVTVTLDGSNNIVNGMGYRYLADTSLRLTIGGATVAAKNYVIYLTHRKVF